MALVRGKRRFLILFALLTWMGIILFVSSRSSLPTDSPVVGWLGQYQDEVGHIGEYAILGFLAYLALRPRLDGRRTFIFSLAFCMVFSLGDEAFQGLIPNRATEVKDIALDALGAIGALTAMVLLEYRLRKGFPGRDTSGDGEEASHGPTLGNPRR